MKEILILAFLILAVPSFGQKEKDFETITIANVFTPDGETDSLFQPTGIKTEWEIFIFNRWGELIFEGKNLGWDGTFKNEKQPADVYIYKLKYFKGEEKAQLTGNFTLIR